MKGKNKKKTVKSIFFVMKFLIKSVPLYVLFSIILNILKGMLQSFANVWLLMRVIDAVVVGKSFLALLYPVLQFTIFALVVGICNAFFLEWYEKKARQRFSDYMRMQMFEKAIQCDVRYYDNPDFYDNYIWTAKEIDNRAFDVFLNLTMLVQRIATISSIIMMLADVDYELIILIVVCSIINYFIANKQNALQYACDKNINRITQKKRYVDRVFLMQENLKEIHSSSLPNVLVGMYDKAGEDQRKEINDATRKIWKMDLVRFFLGENVLIFVLGIITLAIKVINNDMSLGVFVSGITGLQVIFSSFSFMLGKFSFFRESGLYIAKFIEFWTMESTINNFAEGRKIEDFNNLTVDKIGFSYDERKIVLKDVSFDAHKGQKIAIVGANGSGKTTLLKMLFRLYDVSDGQVCINNENIKEIELNSLRQQYSCLFQDMNLYACSLGENIAMEHTNIGKEKQLTDAAEQSGVADYIDKYENGLDTNITREFDEKGVMLSGGEKSKVGIARALYKKAGCIVLDEPTATMDPFAEEEFNRKVAEFTCERILIVVSHRLTTTVFADKILVMDGGVIIESGSHQELMRKEGLYYRMFQTQAEQYLENIS